MGSMHIEGAPPTVLPLSSTDTLHHHHSGESAQNNELSRQAAALPLTDHEGTL